MISIGHICRLHFAKLAPSLSTFGLIRRQVRWIYTGDRCQIFVASLISLNFVVNIVEACYSDIDPDSALQHAFDRLDAFFSIVFSIELSVNVFSTLIAEFISDGWNWCALSFRPLAFSPHTDTPGSTWSS